MWVIKTIDLFISIFDYAMQQALFTVQLFLYF